MFGSDCRLPWKHLVVQSGRRSWTQQGQKLVLSDALAVQSQGPKVSSLKVVLGSQNCFGISKNALGSQNVLDKIVNTVGIVDII